MALINPKNTSCGLMETVLWENGAYFLLDLHLERLLRSVSFFGRKLDMGSVRKAFKEAALSFKADASYRVRLIAEKRGALKLTYNELEKMPELPVKVAFSDKNTDKGDIFLYHKTTKRDLYDTEYERARAEGYFDLIFMNAQGEVTEGCITNIMIKVGGDYFTPPVPSGLLPGVYRQHLLSSGEFALKEKVLSKEDLLNAGEIFVLNSVRKLVKAKLVERPKLPSPDHPSA